jgi:hypothetical protein
MYSTKTAKTGILKQLLDQLDDYSIYMHYMGKFKVGKLYNSPLRNDDKNPSFAVFKGSRGDLMFKDHGSGLSGNVITFIKELKGIKTELELEKELLRIIRSTRPDKVREVSKIYKTNSPVEIGIVRQPFTKQDLLYWKQYGISLSTLNKFNVFSIKYFLCNRVVSGTYKETNPMYAYKVNDKFKIYRPLNSKYTKWRTNLTNLDVQGFAELPRGKRNLLIITKSLKDVMVLYEMGYDAIAASSETTFIPDTILAQLRSKYKHILILYDRDKTGVQKARSYSNKYGFYAFMVNKKFKAKDISDAVVNTSFNEVKKWLQKELKKYD